MEYHRIILLISCSDHQIIEEDNKLTKEQDSQFEGQMYKIQKQFKVSLSQNYPGARTAPFLTLIRDQACTKNIFCFTSRQNRGQF